MLKTTKITDEEIKKLDVKGGRRDKGLKRIEKVEKKEKNFYLVGECVEDLHKLKGERAAGFRTSFKSFGDNITYKPGYSCVVAASPASGKTYFVLHEVVKLAENEGLKSLIFSPETGTRAEIVALLIHIKSGKTIYDIEGVERIGEEELTLCLKWLNQHFIIIDSDNALSIEDIYEVYEEVTKKYKIKIFSIVVDNINDTKEPDHKNGRQDLSTEAFFNFIRHKNKKHGCYTFLLTHSSSQGSPITQDGVRFYPPITPREVRSGEAIYRKAFLFLTLWRPPHGLRGEDGIYYEKNECHVIVLKAKPANTAVKGFVGKVFFDYKTAKYKD